MVNTWSLKYNIFYQYVIGLETFDKSVIDTELDYYVNVKINEFGVPLDNRATFTKLDWQSWVAAMSTNTTQFNDIISSIYNFANVTPDRVPLTDWYDTISAKCTGFRARTVVGGFYAKMLLVN